MEHKRLQFLVPQYKETEEVISFLLDSIECQVDINKNNIGVIICSDGGNYILDQKFLDKYSYDIDYVICSGCKTAVRDGRTRRRPGIAKLRGV